MKKQNTLKVVKKTFLEKVDINEYFRLRIIALLKQSENENFNFNFKGE